MERQLDNEILSVIAYNVRKIFLEKSYANMWEKVVPGPFMKNRN